MGDWTTGRRALDIAMVELAGVLSVLAEQHGEVWQTRN